jgi:hypothetical protein
MIDALSTAMFAVVFGFLGAALADFSLGFERDQPARILLDLVNIGTVIGASVSPARCHS